MQKHKLYEFDVPLNLFPFILVILLVLIVVGALVWAFGTRIKNLNSKV